MNSGCPAYCVLPAVILTAARGTIWIGGVGNATRARGRGRRPHVRHGAQLASLDIPKHIIVDGPIVTKANAPGMLWMEEQFLI